MFNVQRYAQYLTAIVYLIFSLINLQGSEPQQTGDLARRSLCQPDSTEHTVSNFKEESIFKSIMGRGRWLLAGAIG